MRVTRDKELHEAMLPHYIKFYGAMNRQADAPPPTFKDELMEIRDTVLRSQPR